jgi:uncharacterized heparinase superfamily protein
MLNRMGWYWSRLRSMSYPELIHRCTELGLKWSGKRFQRGWSSFASDRLLEPIPGLRERLLPLQPAIAQIVNKEANKIRSGEFHYLGASWPSPGRLPPSAEFWHLDPVSRAVFSKDRYCFDIPFRHGVSVPEIRRPWELNRLQFLLPLAIDAAHRADIATRDLVYQFVCSWMEGNPPYRGINWVSCIEIGLRAISVALAFSVIGVAHLKREERVKLSRFFAAHEFWISRYPSLYSSANNHLIAELAGLVTCTRFARGNSNTDKLGRNSLERLLDQIPRQILSDGVGAEQAPSYSAFALELALVGLYAFGRSADDLPETVRERIAAYADHVHWLLDPTGRIPDIGDWDNSRVIAMTQEPERHYAASIASAVRGYLGKAGASPGGNVPHIRDSIFRSIGIGRPPAAGMRTWVEGGYTVIRGGPTLPFVLTFDHGPLGFLGIAAHGHADALAIWLSIRDRPVIVDAGTCLYHSDPLWRERFRSTRAHNTLNVAGKSSSRSAGPFNWATKANVRLIKSENATHSCVVAEHDGFLAEFGVCHRRTLEVFGDRNIRIGDELLGAPVKEQVTISFLVDPSCQARLCSDKRTTVMIACDGDTLLEIAGNGILKPRIVRGSEAEGLGWISPTFGLRIPTDQILFEGHLEAPSVIDIRMA